MKQLKKTKDLLPLIITNCETNKLIVPSAFNMPRELKIIPLITEANETGNKKNNIIKLNSPYLKKKYFKTEIKNELLKINIEKKEEQIKEAKNSRRKEYSYEAFIRSITHF